MQGACFVGIAEPTLETNSVLLVDMCQPPPPNHPMWRPLVCRDDGLVRRDRHLRRLLPTTMTIRVGFFQQSMCSDPPNITLGQENKFNHVH